MIRQAKKHTTEEIIPMLHTAELEIAYDRATSEEKKIGDRLKIDKRSGHGHCVIWRSAENIGCFLGTGQAGRVANRDFLVNDSEGHRQRVSRATESGS